MSTPKFPVEPEMHSQDIRPNLWSQNGQYRLVPNGRYSYVGRDTDDVKIDVEESRGESESKECSCQTVDPSGLFYQIWLAVVSVATIYNMYFVVARAVFWQLDNLNPEAWFIIDCTCDTIYVIDIVIHLWTGFMEDGILVTDKCRILRHYLCSCGFILDTASIFPTDLMYLMIGRECSMMPCPVILRINRVLRFHRLREFFYITEVRTRYYATLRVLEMSIYILIFVHWNACFYFGISYALGFGSDPWVFPKIAGEFASLMHQYVYCVLWSSRMLVSHSAGANPVLDIEFAVVLAEIFLGVLIFASILGNITSILNQRYAKRVQFQSKMEDLKLYFTRRKVDPLLQAKTLKWCDYVYRTNQPFHENEILSHLQLELQYEISRDVHKDTLRNMILFEGAEDALLNKIVMKLKLNVFCPGDYICKEGNIGNEMYIKKSGKLRIHSTRNSSIHTDELHSTMAFGDLFLADEGYGPQYGCRSIASVISVGYSEIYSLSKSDLEDCLEDYPDFKSQLESHATIKRTKLGLQSEESLVSASASYSVDDRYA